ncbi:MAG: ComEC/Rec2 family competence protein [Lachnospiraceae bacterium]
MLGRQKRIRQRTERTFKDQGIAHILSVSGLHISVVGLAACGLLMKLTGSFAISGMAGSLLFFLFCLYWKCSLDNSCLCHVSYFNDRGQKGRIYDMPTAAAATALCLLIFQPLAIFQASMQLSFGAVLGISLVGDIFKKILMPSSDKTTVRINRFCSVMGLSIAMLPVLLYHYYQYPLYAILLNQLVIPFAGILLVSPAVALVLSLFAPAFGAVCLKAGHLVIYFYTVLCKLSKSLPESAQCTGRPALWRIVLYVTLLFTIGIGTRLIYEKRKQKQTDDDKEKLKKDRRRCQIAAVFLAIGCYIFGCVFLHADHTNKLEITVLDVGQGDGIFLMLPDHTTILSDGGSTSKSMLDTYVLEPFLNSQGIRRIDYVFVSHADCVHINGIIGLIENDADRIGTLMLPQSQSSKKQFEQLLTAAKRSRFPLSGFQKEMLFH